MTGFLFSMILLRISLLHLYGSQMVVSYNKNKITGRALVITFNVVAFYLYQIIK